MWPRFWKPLVIVIPSAAIVLAVLYMTYRFIDPIPPRHFMIAAGMAASGYDNFARQYARILAREGVELEVRNAAGAVEDLNLLRDGDSGVQAGRDRHATRSAPKIGRPPFDLDCSRQLDASNSRGRGPPQPAIRSGCWIFAGRAARSRSNNLVISTT